MIVAGGGVLISGAWQELTALAERLNIPVATSINGKGSIAEISPVSIGVIGGNGARAYANGCLADADLVLYVGSRTDSTTTCHWSVPDINEPPQSFRLTWPRLRLVTTIPCSWASRATPKLALAAIEAAIDHPTQVAERNLARVLQLQAERDRYWAEVDDQASTLSRPIKPAQVCAGDACRSRR